MRGVTERHVDELPLLVKYLAVTELLEGSGFDTDGAFAVVMVQRARVKSDKRLYWLKILDDRTQTSFTLDHPVPVEDLGIHLMIVTGHGDDRVFQPFHWTVKDAPARPWPALRVLKGVQERKPTKKRRRSSR